MISYRSLKYAAASALLLLFMTACSRPCCNYNVVGPDEFVIDSYRIRQGKLAILEMTGEEIPPLPCDAMEEYQDAIVEDDLLTIALYHPSRKEIQQAFEFINHTVGGFKVTNGEVDLPDIPPVEVEGLTLLEAQRKIQKEIQKHYRDAEVFISYRDRLSRKVDLAGGVSVPVMPADGKVRLYEMLAKARINPRRKLIYELCSSGWRASSR